MIFKESTIFPTISATKAKIIMKSKIEVHKIVMEIYEMCAQSVNKR